PGQRQHALGDRPDALLVLESEEQRGAAAVVAEVQRCVGDAAAALAVAILADQLRAPVAGHRHVEVHAVGPLHVDVRPVVAVQALRGHTWQRERGLEAAELEAQPILRRLVSEVGLVHGDVAEGGAGSGRRVAAQVDVGAVLVAAEAARDPRAHPPALVEAAFGGQPQARVERILLALAAVAREPRAGAAGVGRPAAAAGGGGGLGGGLRMGGALGRVAGPGGEAGPAGARAAGGGRVTGGEGGGRRGRRGGRLSVSNTGKKG